MSGDIELNLDTQARRLAEIADVIDAALSDEVTETGLVSSPRRQSYAELTAYNDALRVERGWKDLNLDAALTDQQRAAWELWQQKHRLNWRRSDYLAVGAAGLVGLMCSWFDASLDGAVRERLARLTDLGLGKRWEAAGKGLPIDYMGPGFGGRAHRVKSAGHDMARPIEAIRQVMSGEFRGVSWAGGVATEVVNGQYQTLSAPGAAVKLGQHLLADVVTQMSLPIPGMSLLYEGDSKALRDFALHAYSGLRPGTGWNVRSGLITPGMTVVATEVLVRTYVHAEAYSRTGSAELDRQEQRRRTELLLAAHGLVSAISLGKATAQVAAHCATGNYLRAAHPSHIRHANLPALLRTGTLAATAVTDSYRASKIPGARSWDELLAATAAPWQLDLIDQIETLGVTSANDLLPEK